MIPEFNVVFRLYIKINANIWCLFYETIEQWYPSHDTHIFQSNLYIFFVDMTQIYPVSLLSLVTIHILIGAVNCHMSSWLSLIRVYSIYVMRACSYVNCYCWNMGVINSLSEDLVYILDPNLVIIVPADALASTSARPSTGILMSTKIQFRYTCFCDIALAVGWFWVLVFD